MEETTGTTVRTQQIIDWLTEHPGFYQPQQVAVEVGCTTHQAAMTLRYLSEKREPRIRRLRVDDPIHKSVYGAF